MNSFGSTLLHRLLAMDQVMLTPYSDVVFIPPMDATDIINREIYPINSRPEYRIRLQKYFIPASEISKLGKMIKSTKIVYVRQVVYIREKEGYYIELGGLDETNKEVQWI